MDKLDDVDLDDIMLLLDECGVESDEWLGLNDVEQLNLLQILIEMTSQGYSDTLAQITDYDWEQEPVDPETFYTDPYFFGEIVSLYPKLLSDIVQIMTDPSIMEVILTGAIGWGKSYMGAAGMCYEIYRILCMRSPQKYCGIAPGTKIVQMNMSVTGANAQSVLYGLLVEWTSKCPWFLDHFPVDKKYGLIFPEKCYEFRPGSSSEMAVIGENLIGGALDEANFMVGVRRTKRAVMAQEFDVAQILYDNIARRRKSRFIKVLKGELPPPARMWLISSKQFPDDFLERRIRDIQLVEASGEISGTAVLDYNQWTPKIYNNPRHPYSNQWFLMFIGDALHNSHVIEKETFYNDETKAISSYSGIVPNGCEIEAVPKEYLGQYISDPYGSIRDISGRAILASHPFFTDTASLKQIVCNSRVGDVLRRHPYEFVNTEVVSSSLFLRNEIPVTFDEDGLPRPLLNPNMQRFIHVDLAQSRCAAAIAMGHFGGYKDIPIKQLKRERQDDGTILEYYEDWIERRPINIFDFLLRILPASGSQIDIDAVRSLVYTLQTLWGISRFGKITYDQFQSTTSIQALKAQNYEASLFSVDRNPEAYHTFRQSVSDGRFSCYEYPPLIEDIGSLEDCTDGKIRKRQGGTKDVSDCVAAVCFHIEEEYGTQRVPLISNAGKDDDVKTLENVSTDPFALEKFYQNHGILGDA